jgi:hypothetical protein
MDLPTTDPTNGTQVILSGTVANDDDVNIPAPTTGVPEPSTFIPLFVIGCFGIHVVNRQVRKRTA